MKNYIIYYRDHDNNALKVKFPGADEADAARYISSFWGYFIEHIIEENAPQPEDEMEYMWNDNEI